MMRIGCIAPDFSRPGVDRSHPRETAHSTADATSGMCETEATLMQPIGINGATSGRRGTAGATADSTRMQRMGINGATSVQALRGDLRANRAELA